MKEYYLLKLSIIQIKGGLSMKQKTIYCILLIAIMSNFIAIKEVKSREMLFDISEKIHGTSVEYGINVILQDIQSDSESFSNVLRNKNNYLCINERDNDKGYYGKFQSDNDEITIKGIKGLKEKKYDILIKNKYGHIGSKEYFKLLNLKSKKIVRVSDYIKVKLSNDDLKKYKNMTLIELSKLGFKNIETVSLRGGYSGTAKRNLFFSNEVGDKMNDLNFALCRYDSGNYLVLGTPVITALY
jgi:hypothetical protein